VSQTLTAPGTQVTLSQGIPTAGAASPSAAVMLAGFSDRGTPNVPLPCSSSLDYGRRNGGRSGTAGLLSDSVDLAFGEGASTVMTSRVVGPGAVTGQLALKDSLGATTLVVTPAWGPGASSSDLAVQVTVTGQTFTLTVFDALSGSTTVPVEVYQGLTDYLTAMTTVNTTSARVRLADGMSSSPLASRNPVAISATQLSPGSDDRTGAGDAQRAAALAGFASVNAPGFLLGSGWSTASSHALLMAAGVAQGRLALLDPPDLPGPADFTSLVSQDALNPGAARPGDVGCLVGPWVTQNGRVIPASAAYAGLAARNDVAAGHSARACLGRYGALQYADGVHGPLTEAQRITANGDIGTPGASILMPASTVPVRSEGFRTVSADLLDYSAAGVRETLWVAFNLRQIARQFKGTLLDGQRLGLTAYGDALDTWLTREWAAGGLYGATKSASFSVDVGVLQNTGSTIAGRQMHAGVHFVVSESGERVYIDLVRDPIPATA
jgi:hypothetical protein